VPSRPRPLSESKPSAACHGNCCVYFASKTGRKPDGEQTWRGAMGLFGCADMSANKINVMVFTEQAYGVCISNGDGCGDCFGYLFLGDWRRWVTCSQTTSVADASLAERLLNLRRKRGSG
jgi:hypothetical protein